MGLAIVPALAFRSVVDVWYVFGSVGTPALLVPVLASFAGKKTPKPAVAFAGMFGGGLAALVWYLSRFVTESGESWLDLAPIFPGLAVSIAVFAAGWGRGSR